MKYADALSQLRRRTAPTPEGLGRVREWLDLGLVPATRELSLLPEATPHALGRVRRRLAQPPERERRTGWLLAGASLCVAATAAAMVGGPLWDPAPAQLDLAVQALLCGATNVASVQLSHTVSPVVCTWLGESEAHHELSHADDGNTAGVQSFVNCERWFAEQFRYLVEQVRDAVHPETGASLLDSTVVLWVKELGDSRLHVCTGVPWILAGTGNGFFRTGRHVEVGTTHDGVLTSVANAFGLPLSTFGAGTSGPAEVLR